MLTELNREFVFAVCRVTLISTLKFTSRTYFLHRTRCFREAYTGLPVVRATENQKALNCVAGRGKERRSVGREGGGTACKDAIVLFIPPPN